MYDATVDANKKKIVSKQTNAYQIRLTPFAKIFYDEWQLKPQSDQYNLLCADHVLEGKLSVGRLRNSLVRYVQDHLVLNSHIISIDGVPYWIKNSSVNLLDYSPEPLPESALLDYVKQSFDLRCGPLYRFMLIRTQENTYRFIIVMHHLLIDGLALSASFFEKISEYYNNENYSEKLNVNEQINLLDNLQRSFCPSLEKRREDAAEFWKQQLFDVEGLDLRFLKSPPELKQGLNHSPNPIKKIKFNVGSKEIANNLDKLKAMYQISPYLYGQCIFSLVLHLYTGQNRFAICYPIAAKEGFEFVCGSQVNTNLIPYEFDESTKFTDLLIRAREFFELTIKSNAKYGYHPITEIMKDSNNKSLLNVCFSQAYFRDALFQFEGISKVKLVNELGVDGVPPEGLIFESEPQSNSGAFQVKYDSRVICEEFLLSFIECYKKLFREVLEDLVLKKDKPIIEYSLLDQKTSKKILSTYSNNEINTHSVTTLHEAFEKKALEFPDNIAITHKGEEISYRTLNERTNQLANYLRTQYEIFPDDCILLCLDKNDFMVTSILGVLKSSAAYVPALPYPEERLIYIIKDVSPKAIITNKKYSHQFKGHANVIVIDEATTQGEIRKASVDSPSSVAKNHHLSYVIYTSGTTGKPKGVMQQHDNVLELLIGMNKLYHMNENDVWLFFHSYVFDFSIWEIFGALLYGGKLIIPTREEVKDSISVYELCHKQKVTIFNQTPSAFYYFMETAIKYKDTKYLCYLRHLILAGEALNFSVLSRWFSVYPDDKPSVFNVYGITETTVFTTIRRLYNKDTQSKASYIGRPIPGRNVYVLDSRLCPVPVGAIGELYSSGGIARGYLNQVALTKRRFFANPFEQDDTIKNNVLYKSGDLVRMLPDADLEYLGRQDCQVKIRGYRIELGEIEAALTSHPSIERAVVFISSKKSTLYEQDKYLVAYYVATEKLTSSSLKTYVSKKLPAFMWPSIFFQIEKFPITVNGKVDLKALPELHFQSEQAYKPPSNIKEKLVCYAFSSVLGVEKVGVNDNFFELGGNSIKAISLTLILQRNFELKVADIFALQTPKAIAKNKLIKYDLLETKLERIKGYFNNKKTTLVPNEKSQKKIKQYLSELDNLKYEHFTVKPIRTVLLTGSTGYLGCNILKQLLETTDYSVCLLVRADDDAHAAERVEQKFHFYFNNSIKGWYASRVSFIKADMAQENFGLAREAYQALAKKVDSVIHAAALVKHQGHEDLFYTANVKATERLLEFASQTNLKDFHYISTCSVAHYGGDSYVEQRIFTENDLPDCSANWGNIYNKTKFFGENQTVKWRIQGVKSNIYRIGNLAFISENGKAQENVEDNAFINWLRFLLKIGCVAKEISEVQVSTADLTAKAIVKLFDKRQIVNKTLHVFNPNLVNLLETFKNSAISIEDCSLNQFVDRIMEYLREHSDCELLGKFLLHQGWLESDDIIDKRDIKIMQSKTEFMLKKLDFRWPSLTPTLLEKFLRIVS